MIGDPQEILRERARALARPLADGHARTRSREVLRWDRDGQTFAVAVAAARAITAAERLAVVPHAPTALVGMAAYRGGLLPVYDPSALLAFSTDHAPRAPWALVIDDDAPFGLLADSLPQIADVTGVSLQPASTDLPSEARRCIEGVHPHGWVLLSSQALRTDPRLASTTERRQRETRSL